jgi:hypothetical protein
MPGLGESRSERNGEMDGVWKSVKTSPAFNSEGCPCVVQGMKGLLDQQHGHLHVRNGMACIDFIDEISGKKTKMCKDDKVSPGALPLSRFEPSDMRLIQWLCYHLIFLISTRKQTETASNKKLLIQSAVDFFNRMHSDDSTPSTSTFLELDEMIAEIRSVSTVAGQDAFWQSTALEILSLIPLLQSPTSATFHPETSTISVVDSKNGIEIIIGDNSDEDHLDPCIHLRHQVALLFEANKDMFGNDQHMFLNLLNPEKSDAEFKLELLHILESEHGKSAVLGSLPSSRTRKRAVIKKELAANTKLWSHTCLSLKNLNENDHWVPSDLQVLGLILRLSTVVMSQTISQVQHTGPPSANDVEHSKFAIEVFPVPDSSSTVVLIHQTWVGGVTSWKTGSMRGSLSSRKSPISSESNSAQKKKHHKPATAVNVHFKAPVLCRALF